MQERYEAVKKVTYLSIMLNVFLTGIKIFAGILGNSAVIITDGLHSASDIISSIGVLIANKISNIPNDDDHNYGHEKVETIVSFLLSILLMYVSLKIVLSSLNSIFNLSQIETPTMLPLLVSIVSIAIKEYQYRITIKVAKRINSTSLKADAWHHRSDALSSVAAFIGIGGSMLGFKALDPIASIIVAFFVANVGFDILKNSTNELMDQSISDEDRDMVIAITQETEGVVGIGDIKTRKHGAMAYVDLTICVPENLNVSEAHDIATEIEDGLINDIDIIKGVTVHVEPCANCTNKGCTCKKEKRCNNS